MRLFVVVLNLLQNVLEMLNLITFTTTGCETSRMIEERVEQAIIDMNLEQNVHNEVAILEINPNLAREYKVKDAPVVVCKNTGFRIEGLHSPSVIRAWIRGQIQHIAYGED